MTATTDEDALLAAICGRPADDLPREVYADWLDENARDDVPCERCGGMGYNVGYRGGHITDCSVCRGTGVVSDGRREHAEFVRVQKACADLERTGMTWFHRDESNDRVDNPAYAALVARQGELWASQTWFPRPGFPVAYGLSDAHPVVGEGGAQIYAQVQRGFAATVRGPIAAFWEDGVCGACRGRGDVRDSGPYTSRHDRVECTECSGTGRVSGPTAALRGLMARQPVERVEFSDVQPRESYEAPGMWRLPLEVCRVNYKKLSCWFDTSTDALTTLSEALLAAAHPRYAAAAANPPAGRVISVLG